ncbi:hypothetical protein PFDSM3638_02735 [Pyrococcus furiosus DSM 3638]|uniref:Uncharacterized protein n=3 Tax=Pyrococcus furiosus TaxID=2261 RepID=Q8U3C5_PYRFU|nr:hypothetical protein [Pyrococcus furiosus]AAL80669.1 hypothetical protein PF0545 [Pyrococcus furiosus DSM 3638]AFN03341.1 hypothetical protein PFC_01850 [Pyrococcus furiosus COM1]QEK78256.1 hypothetical protein PFDSM3638_02735 [Pyrococcus furiosus DSM 3638]
MRRLILRRKLLQDRIFILDRILEGLSKKTLREESIDEAYLMLKRILKETTDQRLLEAFESIVTVRATLKNINEEEANKHIENAREMIKRYLEGKKYD